MQNLIMDAVVLFVGGPNHGFIEVGQAALFHVLDLEPPKPGVTSAPIQGEPVKPGKRFMMMPKYAQDAMQKIGMQKAIEIWAKHGVGHFETSIYELSEVDGSTFVYKYLGQHAEVYPEKV